MSYYGYKPYVSVAARRLKAEKLAAKAKKSGAEFTPVEAFRGGIAKTFWGKAWCDNLEHYSDFANRLPRGRSYVRNGSVVDLKVTAGEVHAKVMGSSLYAVEIKMTAVAAKQWQTLGAECSGSIDSLVELLQGKLSKAVMERICKPSSGLFPSPKDIHFKCSCPDWASMCKHVAAVFYGIGARLDQQPALLFTLRCVDASDLVAQAAFASPVATGKPSSRKVLDDTSLADVFGIDMAEPISSIPETKPKNVTKLVAPPATKKSPTSKNTAAARKTKAPAVSSAKVKLVSKVKPAAKVKAKAKTGTSTAGQSLIGKPVCARARSTPK